MQGLDKQTYWEIIIHPNGFVEQFADFILQKTSYAIEYLDITPSNPFAIIYNDDSWKSIGFDIQKAKQSTQPTQIISRIGRDDIDLPTFIESLRDFALWLTDIHNERIGFYYHIEEKQNCDWIAAYKDSITPVQCGRFYIRPLWRESSHKQGKNDKEIIISPALAFGSGHHASTAMCLELLGEIDLQNKTLLDVGCGSGILSIGACKLGAEVYACDTDECAIEESRKNATLNQVNFKKIWQSSIAQSPLDTPMQYDVIMANIVPFVLNLLHDDLKAKCRKNGLLILSGILDEYKFDIIKAFNDFDMLDTCCKDGWVALKLTL